MRANQLRRLWQANRPALNAWLTIPSAWTAEVLAQAGFDALTIDMQHGLADYAVAVAMLQAISTTDAVPLARVPWNDPAILMRLLDAGAYGIVCPMVNTRAEAEAFVGACRYPPAGYRSFGPIRASVYSGADYYSKANDEVLTLAMIETAQAMDNLADIVSTPGLDGVYIGTVDLSISLGLPGLGDLDDPVLRAAVERILALVRAHGRVAGMHAASPEQAVRLMEWGLHLVTPVTDHALLSAAARGITARVRELQGAPHR